MAIRPSSSFDLNGSSLLVTGGTGSFGKAFIARLLNDFPRIRRLVVLSRDELKQFEMAQMFSPKEYPQMRYFLGDVRDKDRLHKAFEGIDYVIHAAALKQVPAAEYNPMEFIKTNVLGAENVIDAAIHCGVKRVVALSTDKAAAPINLYGATKLCSDKLFVAANNTKGHRDIRFSVVRYGNVMGSRGSVIPFFLDRKGNGVLPITDPQMSRFNISLEEGIDLVLFALETAWGGEVFVPKLPSYNISVLAEAIDPKAKQETVGIRPGEKLHEDMFTATDSYYTVEFEEHYEILPAMPAWDPEEFLQVKGGTRTEKGKAYNSGENTEWLTVEEIRELIRTHIDPAFAVE